MQMTKKVVSIVLAVMMVVSMMVVGAVSVSAMTDSDLDAALAAGGTVTLDSDVDYGSSYAYIPAGVTVTLDLNGYKITSTSFALVNDGTLTIKDSSNPSTGLIKGNYAIRGRSGSKTTINSGNFESTEATVSTGSSDTGATITIKGGTFTSHDNAPLMGNGSATAGNNKWTISGGTFNGEMTSGSRASNYTACAIYAPNNDTWTISGGTFNVTDGVGIVQRAGTVKVTGGTFNVTGDGTTGRVGDSRIVVPSGTAIVYDSKAEYPNLTDSSQTTVTGGTFTAPTPVAQVKNDGDATRVTVSGGTFENTFPVEFLSNTVDCELDTTSGKYNIVDAGTSYVARIGENRFSALSDAISNATNGDTIVITDNIDLGSAWATINGKNINIDLGGKTITSADTVLNIKNGAKVTVTNGTMKSTCTSDAAVYSHGNNAEFTLANNAKIEAAFTGVYAYDTGVANINGEIKADYANAYIYEDGTINLNDGADLNSAEYGVVILENNSVLNVNDGASIVAKTFGISSNGTAGNEGYKINITGGTVKSTDGSAIYHQNDGELNISGGTIEGPTAIYIKSGRTNITGGTFKSVLNPGTTYVYNGNGCNATGDTIVIENAGSSYQPVKSVSISNGTFTTTDTNKSATATYAKESGAPMTKNFVSGGSFSSAVPEESCADGWVPAPLNPATGMYTVEADTNPLNYLEAESVSDGNKFGLSGKYLMGTLLGVQKKDYIADADKTSENKEQETGKDIRFVAVLDREILQGADDYGFVLARLNDTSKTYGTTVFDNLKAYFGNGEKTVSAMGTYNNVCSGNEAYGDPTDNSTDYKYITCAVNGLESNDRVVARFFVKKGGKTYYSKYAGQNYDYTGCIAAYSDFYS